MTENSKPIFHAGFQVQGRHIMVRLRILEILEEQNHTKYWLFKQMDLSYQNFNRMVSNQTKSIRFENLDRLSDLLGCSIGELFEKTCNSSEE